MPLSQRDANFWFPLAGNISAAGSFQRPEKLLQKQALANVASFFVSEKIRMAVSEHLCLKGALQQHLFFSLPCQDFPESSGMLRRDVLRDGAKS